MVAAAITLLASVASFGAILVAGSGSAAAQGPSVWIGATYNNGHVYSDRSNISLADVVNKVQRACGPSCPEPRAVGNACIALAINPKGAWGSDWGNTIAEAESKAIRFAETAVGIRGPFQMWSDCA